MPPQSTWHEIPLLAERVGPGSSVIPDELPERARSIQKQPIIGGGIFGGIG